jgi:hypothetical protein
VQKNYGRETFTKKKCTLSRELKRVHERPRELKSKFTEFKREVERVRETARHPGGVCTLKRMPSLANF